MPEIHTREREGVVLIDISGSMSCNAGSLRGLVAESLARGRSGVVLNLQEAIYIDSTRLGAAMTKLSTIFDIFTSEDDAVNSFFPSRRLLYPRVMREQEATPQVSKEDRLRLRVFLCHSSADRIAVRELHRHLLVAGAIPWLDEVDLLPGQVWEREIPTAVRRSGAVRGSRAVAAVAVGGPVCRGRLRPVGYGTTGPCARAGKEGRSFRKQRRHGPRATSAECNGKRKCTVRDQEG